jgi:hypothetical protein
MAPFYQSYHRGRNDVSAVGNLKQAGRMGKSSLLLQKKFASPKTTVMCYNTIVLPFLLYGSESWVKQAC